MAGRNPFAALKQASSDKPAATRARKSAAERRTAVLEGLGRFCPRRVLAGLAGGLVAGAARVVVPFPPAGLNPNARHAHPAQKGKLAKAYRETCRALTLEALGAGQGARIARLAAGGPIRVHLEFFPPDGRARDDDNVEAAFKPGRDGIAAALGLDDARWATTRRLRSEVRGCVVVTIVPEGGAV